MKKVRSMLQTILDTIPARVFWKDPTLRYLGCNLAFARNAGLADPAAVVGKSDYDLAWKEQAELYRRDDREVLESGHPKLGYVEPQTSAKGDRLWLRTSKLPLRDSWGRIHGILGTSEDITAEQTAADSLREKEERWRLALEINRQGVWDWNARTGEVFYCAQWKLMLGYEEHEVGSSLEEWLDRVHPEDRSEVQATLARSMDGELNTHESEYRLRCKDGSHKWIHCRGMVMERGPDGRPLRIVGTHSDITTRKDAEIELHAKQEKLHYFASTDELTGLLNRRTGFIVLEKQLELSRRERRILSLCFIDLDGLKAVNDSYGHAEGDELIATLCRILTDTVRVSDTVCRMGGDEFIIIFPGCDKAEASQILRRVIEKTRAFNAESNKPYQLVFSYGIEQFLPPSMVDADGLIRMADSAMYMNKQAKRLGGGEQRLAIRPEQG